MEPINGSPAKTATEATVLHPAVIPTPTGMTCMCTWEDLSISDGSYAEYRTSPSGTWHASKFSSSTLRHLLKTSFKKYLDDVEKASRDCAAAVRRIVTRGPPVYLSDKNALPIPEDSTDSQIDLLWFSDTNEEIQPILEGCLQGVEREKLWNSQKETLKIMEQVEKEKSVQE